MCYVITPHNHQWFKINAKEIPQNHELALCDDKLACMILYTSPKTSAINAYMTIARLMLLQAEDRQINDICNTPV